MIEFFLEIPMELQVIILSCITMGVIQFIKDEKEKIDKNMRVKKVLKRELASNRKYKTTIKILKNISM
ncbi:MAG: hypothetical protein CM15mV8_1960 [Caudoviricetes sp.]|nr:MAG: hypothetical protein CM15mV8_1960 [Caudoviricetes sp.]